MSTDLRQDAGQMITVGFGGYDLEQPVARALREGRIGGVILFSRNVDTPEQVADLNAAVYAAAGEHPIPFIAVDQEGGRVQRLKDPLTRIPPMARVGATRDFDLACSIGEVIGAELEALGFNLDFAPIVDVLTNPDNPVIGDRAFGTTPEHVGRMAGAVMGGLIMSGMMPCAKHFPGHGDTELDSHFDLPYVRHDAERLQDIELAPFRSLIKASVPMIMTAHIIVPAIDERHPATLSHQWLTGILRRTMHYGGLIVSDDLEMKAVADRYTIEEMVELGLPAGLDIFLVCHTREKWETVFETLVKMGESSSFAREQIAMAAGRIRDTKAKYLRPWTRPADVREQLGTKKHLELVQRVLAKSESVSE